MIRSLVDPLVSEYRIQSLSLWIPDLAVGRYVAQYGFKRFYVYADEDSEFGRMLRKACRVGELFRYELFDGMKSFGLVARQFYIIRVLIRDTPAFFVFQLRPGEHDRETLRAVVREALLLADRLQSWRLMRSVELLEQLSRIVGESISRDELLTKTVRFVRDSVPASGCTLFLADNNREKLSVGATTGLVKPRTGERLKPGDVFYKYGEGAAGWVAEKRTVLRLSDAMDRSAWRRIDPSGALRVSRKSHEGGRKQGSSRSVLIAPVLVARHRAEPELFAVIRLHRQRSRQPFLPFDEDLIQTVCRVLAPALSAWNGWLREEREIQLHDALTRITEAAAADRPNPLSVLEQTAAGALRLFKAHAVHIFIADPQRRVVSVATEAGRRRRNQATVTLDYGQGLVGYCAENAGVLAVPDVRRDERYRRIHPNVRSELCAPIEYEGRLAGVLNIDSSSIGEFHPNDSEMLRVVKALADHAGRMLERVSVLEERAGFRRSIVRTVETMTAATVAAGLAHEMRNRLGVIRTKIQYLSLERFLKSDVDRRRWAELNGEIASLSNMAQWLLEHGGVDRPVKTLTLINRLVESRVRTMEDIAQASEIKLVLKADAVLDDVEIEVDAEQIVQALTNLILNAIQASRPGLTVVVRTADRRNGWVAISVRDVGRGITPATRRRLFEMFYTEKDHGFGVGLPTVLRIVKENHAGRLRFRSQPGKGSVFTMEFPKLLVADQKAAIR